VSRAGPAAAPGTAARGERFTVAMAAIVRRLPFGLAGIIPPTLLGFAVINGSTFALDLGLLTILHGALRWPLPAAFTVSYITALGLSYLLNRALNFRSHAAVGPQVAVYAAVVAVNYLAWILGVADGLAALGLDYRLARIVAGACEALYMYAAMRWVVFRDVQRAPAQTPATGWPRPDDADPPPGIRGRYPSWSRRRVR
jgi:putative flippase GtrA